MKFFIIYSYIAMGVVLLLYIIDWASFISYSDQGVIVAVSTARGIECSAIGKIVQTAHCLVRPLVQPPNAVPHHCSTKPESQHCNSKTI